MPDAARLVAALSLALVALLLAPQIARFLPAGLSPLRFMAASAIIGFICGWSFLGCRAGRGILAAIAGGVTGVALLALGSAALLGCFDMIGQAGHMRLRGPLDAVEALVTLGTGRLLDFGDLPLVAQMFAGALFAGLATEYAKRRWR
ncbi:TrgA family protein [Pontibaca methylaminivorans]|uniref:Uncharacterized protein n=1 Tax=Pontibaca methylaminivorans TaxID=515897 RepID=A0A1R3WB79_9RHOB|nr:TrgA family protein [Pontibaca methylaminivorans]SIT75060.1 hypothetical protein SAMN05421849_0261 [Pontibaca methylaminivorans]